MRKLMLAVVVSVAASPAFAKDLEISCTGCQGAFDQFAEDLVATIDYRAVGPAEATGIVGLGAGAVLTWVPIDKPAAKGVTGFDFSGLGLAGVQVTKGLPLDLDVGAFYTSIPGTGAKVYGGEVRYAILAGSTVSPAVAVRGGYTKLSGVDSFSLDSKSLDVSVSKGFTLLTPYVGVGYVWGTADPDASTGLKKAEVKDTKAYLGARISLGFIEFTPEIGQVAGDMVYSARLGFSFSL